MKRVLIFIATALAAFGLAAFRPDVASAQDTAAVAVNTKDGSSLFRLAFSIHRAASDVVDNMNAAVAVSSCTDCQTVAISIQVVLVVGDPEVVTPENLALAYNVVCTACDTLASAYQFVLGTGGAPVHFSADGNRELAEIRRELLALRDSGLSGPELQARVDALMQRLVNVLENELVIVRRPEPAQQATTQQGETEPTATEPATTEPTPPPATTTDPLPETTETTETVPTETGTTTTTP